MDGTRLFVYGSLQRGMPYEQLMVGARFEGIARTTNAYQLVLYDEGYPALTKPEAFGGAGVWGELYWVGPTQLGQLDDFEDCPLVYQREFIELVGGGKAAAYCISWEKARGREVIERWHPGLVRGRWR